MRIQIRSENSGDLGMVWLIVDTDLLVLEHLQPLPRALLVREGTEKVAGITVHLAAIVDAVEIPERCVVWPRVAEEFGSCLHIDGLNHAIGDWPVLRQTGVSALDPPAGDLGEPASEDAENIVQRPEGMKPTPLDALEQLEDVWSGQQSPHPAVYNDTGGAWRGLNGWDVNLRPVTECAECGRAGAAGIDGGADIEKAAEDVVVHS